MRFFFIVLLMTKLDQIDKQILGYLARDCRTPYREIAKSLGLSATAIKSRVDELVVARVITDFIVEFTPAMIGSEAMMLWLKTDGREDSNKFISEIATIRGVLQIVPIYGGDFLVFVEYTSSLELATITEAFESNPHVNSTEIHTLLIQRGKKTNLSNLQIRVLKALLKDARMSISNIAKDAGLTVRLVRRTLKELKECEAIRFSLRWRLNVGERVTFLLKLKWNPKQTSRNEIIDVLSKKYENELWDALTSVSEPILIAIATVDNLNDVNMITTEVKSHAGILYSEAFVYRPPYNYKSLKRLSLEEFIQAAGI